MQAASLDWNDLRYLLAAHQAGSFAGAARALRVDQATVGRRLRALQERAGVALLERAPGRMTLTEAGRRALRAAERMDEAALQLERALDAGVAEVTGALRITATEALASRVVAPRLAGLTARHPGLAVELLSGNQSLNLSRRDADLAVRLFRPAEPALAVRRAGTLAFGLYASRAYLKSRGPVAGAALGEHDLIGYERTLGASSEALGWADQLQGARVAIRCNSAWSMLAATQAGLGLGVLPCFLADPEPELVRVLPELRSREIWLVVHGEMRRSPRVRVGLDFLAGALAEAGPLLRGDEPRRAPELRSRPASQGRRRR